MTAHPENFPPLPLGCENSQLEQELADIFRRIAPRFARSEPRERARSYLRALLQSNSRRNSWQIARQVGEHRPDGVQRLLTTSRWSADRVRDDLRSYVVDRLGHPHAVLAVVTCASSKRGPMSAGAGRQYNPTAHRTDVCQLGAFLAYVTRNARVLLDRELYLPPEWAADPARRRAAAVPPEVPYQSGARLAVAMVQRALAAAVPAAWVAWDAGDGDGAELRGWLLGRGVAHVVRVPGSLALGLAGDPPSTSTVPGPTGWGSPAGVAARVPGSTWWRGPAGVEWARVLLRPQGPAGAEWLLLRRPAAAPQRLACYLAAGPPAASLDELVGVTRAGRLAAGICRAARLEAGLGSYEVRRYDAWYRHTSLAMLAHAALAAARAPGPGGR